MLKYLFPRVAIRDLPMMIAVALIGGFIAGIYGVLHDQITYSISEEYFTKLKFHQFHFANVGLGDRAFVGTIGFVATCWVGFASAWFLGRRLIPHQPRPRALRQIALGFLLVLLSALLFGMLGYVYGLIRGPDADYSAWQWAIDQYQVTAPWPFIRVAYIHNSSYLGGLLGLITALVIIRPRATR